MPQYFKMLIDTVIHKLVTQNITVKNRKYGANKKQLTAALLINLAH
jgi:hypothetical protein